MIINRIVITQRVTRKGEEKRIHPERIVERVTPAMKEAQSGMMPLCLG
jgi:hypothetical protein